LFLFVFAAALRAEPDPNTSKEILKRELSMSPKEVVEVSVGQHTPTSIGAIVVDAEVTSHVTHCDL
jgi:hypothetical protein